MKPATFLNVCLTLFAAVHLNALVCNIRDYYGSGSIWPTIKKVCVCNYTYCDTIPRVEKVSEGHFLLFASNKAGLRFHKTVGNKTKTGKNPDIFIIRQTRYQSVHGFGGAFTDAFGINVMSLPEKARRFLMESYFSKNGIEYSLCRVPIGGSDFSTRAYSYDDGEVDVSLKNFKLVPEDFQYKIPLIKEAVKMTNSNVKLFASVWTAPKWMKSNHEYTGIGSIIKSMYPVWANYFVKFLNAYKTHNITFWGITTQNEPSLALYPFGSINSVGWTPGNLGTWVANYLGPAIRNSQHYSELKIMVLDDQRLFIPWYIDQMFKNKLAHNFTDGIAVHWYWNKIFPSRLLTEVHRKYPDKFILATEACEGSDLFAKHVDLGSWERAERYATDIIENLNNWATGWLDWNMALDLTGGPTYINNNVDSPIIVNASAGEFYKQPMFYALGQFSKFIVQRSVRVSVKLYNDSVKVTAFVRPDNGTVVVILNTSVDSKVLTVTDESGNEMQVTITPSSITSILYW